MAKNNVIQSATSSVPTGTFSPTASSLAGWDTNSNLSANNMIEGYTTTATSTGTKTLTVASSELQYFTGSTTHNVLMPVTSTLVAGMQWTVVNLSSGQVTVKSSGANVIQIMDQNTYLKLTCILTSGSNTASWSWQYGSTNAVLPISAITLTGNSGSITGASLSLLTGNYTSMKFSGAVTTMTLNLLDSNNNLYMTTTNISTSGLHNTIMGQGAGSTAMTSGAIYNSLYGYNCGTAITSGNYNTIIGNASGGGITSGDHIICIGSNAGSGLTTATSTICIGVDAGASITSTSGANGYGIYIGAGSGGTCTINGDICLGRGASPGSGSTVGDNIVIGHFASTVKSTTTVAGGISIGYQAGQNLQTVTAANTLVGHKALATVFSNANANCCFGYQTGLAYTGTESSNILIGYDVEGTASENNVLRIGNGTGSSTGNLAKAYIAGINGVTASSPALVTINTSTDQLGTTTFTTGTWTPTIVGSTSAGTTTYGTQQGTYIRIGSMVIIQCDLSITAATGTGAALIGGLPFTPASPAAGGMYIDAVGWTWPAGTTQAQILLQANGNHRIACSGSATAEANMQMTNAALEIIFTLAYFV